MLRIRRRLVALAVARRGAVTVMTVLFFVGIAVVLGLAVDSGRAYSERQRMQAWLDSVAVSAAAELDGRSDAILRAEWIVEQAGVSQEALWSGSDGGFAVAETVYLSEAPEGGLAEVDAAAFASLVTTDPAEARAIVVYATPRDVEWTALNLLTESERLGGSFEVGARSVAVPIETLQCGAPILAVCARPGELERIGRPGVQLRLDKNLDGLWQEGEYGLVTDVLDDAAGTCAGFTGPERLTCLLALNEPRGACPTGIDLRAGDGIDVSGALNTRFDIWADSVAHLQGLPTVSSDVNTLSGDLYACNGAQFDVVSDSMGLPDDDCFHNGDCGWASGPVDPDALALYWAENHGGPLPGPMMTTRHQVYLHEILEGLLDPEGPEDSTLNQCNPNAEPQAGRRVLEVAFVDCEHLQGLVAPETPVIGRAEALMTAPATHTGSFIATFDGTHGNEWMQAGDIVSQAWTGEASGSGPGNPGNHKEVGNAGEKPNGKGGWGGGARGRSDGDREDFHVELELDRDDAGPGGDDLGFSAFDLGSVDLDGPGSIVVTGRRHSGERVRIDRIVLDGPGALVTIEAEDMAREVFEETSGDRASGGRLVFLPSGTGVLSTEFDVEPGRYDVVLYAQDESDGRSDVEVTIAAGEPLPWPPEDLRVVDERGRMTYDPYRSVGLMQIEVKQSRSADGRRDPWRNVPMLFDTANTTGGDSDLASTRFGNVLIVSEDGDTSDPDDEALGGWILFHFDRPTRIDSLTVFDTEDGGVIRVYDHHQPDPTGEFETRHDGTLSSLRGNERHDDRELAHFAVPRLGDGRHVRIGIGTEGVRTLAYFIPDSGGIDNLEFFNDLTEPVIDDRLTLEIVRMSGGDAGVRAALYD
jgi:Flp pilus assembly protein TadG